MRVKKELAKTHGTRKPSVMKVQDSGLSMMIIMINLTKVLSELKKKCPVGVGTVVYQSGRKQC